MIKLNVKRWYPEWDYDHEDIYYNDDIKINVINGYADPNFLYTYRIWQFLNRPQGRWLEIGKEINFLRDKNCLIQLSFFNFLHKKPKYEIVRDLNKYKENLLYYKKPLYQSDWYSLSKIRRIRFFKEDIRICSIDKNMHWIEAYAYVTLNYKYSTEQEIFLSQQFISLKEEDLNVNR